MQNGTGQEGVGRIQLLSKSSVLYCTLCGDVMWCRQERDRRRIRKKQAAGKESTYGWYCKGEEGRGGGGEGASSFYSFVGNCVNYF